MSRICLGSPRLAYLAPGIPFIYHRSSDGDESNRRKDGDLSCGKSVFIPLLEWKWKNACESATCSTKLLSQNRITGDPVEITVTPVSHIRLSVSCDGIVWQPFKNSNATFEESAKTWITLHVWGSQPDVFIANLKDFDDRGNCEVNGY